MWVFIKTIMEWRVKSRQWNIGDAWLYLDYKHVVFKMYFNAFELSISRGQFDSASKEW